MGQGIDIGEVEKRLNWRLSLFSLGIYAILLILKFHLHTLLDKLIKDECMS